MDLFDERILAALKDGKPKGFTTLLGEVGFSHNTLQQHLDRLVNRGLVTREKMDSNSMGRLKIIYHVLFRIVKQVAAAIKDPHGELVAIPFIRLRHICRFEKGGYGKEERKSCGPQICPQNRK